LYKECGFITLGVKLREDSGYDYELTENRAKMDVNGFLYAVEDIYRVINEAEERYLLEKEKLGKAEAAASKVKELLSEEEYTLLKQKIYLL
jgi:hypothetical protein